MFPDYPHMLTSFPFIPFSHWILPTRLPINVARWVVKHPNIYAEA